MIKVSKNYILGEEIKNPLDILNHKSVAMLKTDGTYKILSMGFIQNWQLRMFRHNKFYKIKQINQNG